MNVSLLAATFAIVIFSVTRLTLLFCTGTLNVPLTLWPGVLTKGLFFDAATLAYLIPPFLVAEALLPSRLRGQRWLHRLGLGLLAGTIFLLLFLAVSEVVFWDEFHTRLNFIALDYLIYTNEVLLNIWQSYPIVWIVVGLSILSAGLTGVLRSRFLSGARPASARQKAVFLALAVIVPTSSFAFVGIQAMYRQGNAFAEELSGNGLFTLAAAARHNELDYDKFYATMPDKKAEGILKSLGVEWSGDVNRRTNDRWGDDAGETKLAPFLIGRPRNVVLVSVESLSAHFVGAYGSTDGNLTPHLDRIAADGLVFSQVFATGTRTVRGLEALSLSTPPIPGQAIVRRPNNAGLASIGEMLRRQGFEAFFFYGGRGYFDNMNAFFSSNGYSIRDRATMGKDQVTFENAWGVADEDLYNSALRVIDALPKAGQPFFAHIMTTSNHRPYTYPKGRIDIAPGGRKGAVKYTDYAIGKFLSDAAQRPWFKDTLFVIVADHCASVSGRTELPVRDYRIPLIFYGPAIVKPGRIDRMISQIDVAPTIFDALGVAGDDNFFGKEVSRQSGAARAFIANYQNLGYYKNDQLVVLKPRRQVEGFRVDPTTLESTPIQPDSRLVEEAIAFYQTASRAFKDGQLKLLWK